MTLVRARGVGGAAAAPAAFAALLMLAACQARFEGGSTVGPPVQRGAGIDAIAAVPLGDLAGTAQLATVIRNPYEGNAQAIAQGHALFINMNCAGCHGYGATGGMGPNLTDGYWRYGGVPVDIFKSIYEGRPQGMPAWNPALPPDEIWKLVSYIESLGGSRPAPNYQASLQGDRPGQNVAAEAPRTLAPGAAPAASAAVNASPAQARPDAGGKP